MNLNIYKNASKLRCFLICTYLLLCCLNQYIKFAGIPTFMFILIIYCFIKIYEDGLIIKNGVGMICHAYRWFLYFLSIWCISGVVSLFFIRNESAFKNVLYIIINSLGFFLMFSDCYYHANVKKWALRGLGIGTLLNICVGFWELKTGTHIMTLSDTYLRRFADRPLGFYANTNDLAVMLVFSLSALVIGYLSTKKSLFKSIFRCLMITSGCLIIISTGSMLSIGCLVCMVIFPLLYYNYRAKNKSTYLWIIAFFFLMLLVLILWGSDFSNFIATFDSSAYESRFEIWKGSWNSFASTFYFGIGPGQNSIVGVGAVHNLFLEIITEYGVVFGAGFILMYLCIFRNITKCKTSYMTSFAVALSLLFIPISICSSSMTKIFPIWPCIGLILAFVYKDDKDFTKERRLNYHDFNSSTNLSY